MNNNVLEKVVEKDYCSGCGVCEISCPKKAIKIDYSDEKMFLPRIDGDLCVDCGLCVSTCPNSPDEKKKSIDILTSSMDSISVGIDNAEGFYRCKSRELDGLIRSASGGFVTEFAKHLLDKKYIDCVVHGERVIAHTGEMHYQACISRTLSEIDDRRSSIYGPISFEKVIRQFEFKKESILFVGVPCAIKGIKKLFSSDSRYSENTVYTIALVCSHNVTGQFVDYLAGYYGVDEGEEYAANLRAKDFDMQDRHSFLMQYKRKNGETILNADRTVFNALWHNYYFAMPSCNYCSDLWGGEADISTKDCWEAEGDRDRYGSSLVIFRNAELMKEFYAMKSLEISALPFERVRVCEYPAAKYKQSDIVKRIDLKNNAYIENSRKSIELFSKGEIETINEAIRAKIHKSQRVKPVAIIKCALKKMRFLHYFIPLIYWGKATLKSVIKIIRPYNKGKYKKVLMLGGFDGKNAGDEAQIDSTVKIMMERYPQYLVKVLSHVPYYTWKQHYNCVVGPNPRVALWNLDEDNYLYCSKLKNKIDRFRFLMIGYWCCFNARLIKHGLPVFLLNSKKAAFLEDIRTSDLLYISGGGTMTGDTLSRCWDNIFAMKIAKIFKVPYALSGQNSGNWDSKLTEHLVKKAYNSALAVTFRDPYAVDNVRKLGVNRENVFTMFDDALFCDKTSDITSYLNLFGIEGKYVAVNIHYWGCESDEQEQKKLLSKIDYICGYLHLKTGMDILLVPMSDTDEVPIEDYLGSYPKEYIKAARFAEYDFRLIRGILSCAELCVTMKHHPIIFALGECIPTISIAYKPYYTYKNAGALDIFGLGKYSIDLEKDNYQLRFNELLEDVLTNRERIISDLKESLCNIAKRRERFFEIIDTVLKNVD